MPDLSAATTVEVTEAAPLGSSYVRSLLNRHSVSAIRHVTTVAEVLGVGYTLAYRRMNGSVAWELEELDRLARHFGESLAEFFAERDVSAHVAAVLLAGPVSVGCELVVGPPVRDPERNTLVATRRGEQWTVLPATLAGEAPCFEVASMRVLGAGQRTWRIAVLDDDGDEAASLAQHLSDRGCEVHAFTEVDTLLLSMQLRRFDGFVLDWILPEGSAAELVGMIRADDRECPIAVLTGKIQHDVMIEPVVAEAVATYKLLFFEKPTRLPIISAQLLQALAGR